MSQQSKKKYVVFGRGIMPTGSGVLQVTCSYENDGLSGVAVVVDDKTLTTNYTGVVTFTDLSGEKTITASKDGFKTDTSTKFIDSSFETKEITMQPVTITFTLKNEENQYVEGATVLFGTTSKTTDSNGQASFSLVLDGTYQYSISTTIYNPVSGNLVVARNDKNEQIVLISTVIQCYAEEDVTANASVKLNAGIGNSDTDYNVYAENTETTNDLTINGTAITSATTGEIANVVPADDTDADITVVANEDDTDIQFNNNNDINEVTINVVAKDLYLAFTQSDKTIYFKNNTLPFIPSDNTFESKSYTYYTYENNAMVSHSATTSSVTVGTNSYDGTTLKLDTSDTYSNGTWSRDNTKDEEIDDGTATITTSGYLTTPNSIIPTDTYFKFSLVKLNPLQWDTTLLIGGQEKKFINYQEFTVKSNQLIEIYYKKHNSNNMIDATGKQFYISNDKIYKKLNYIITSNVLNSTIKFTVNGIEFIYEGSTANIDLYEGDTVNWEVSAEGYTTQSGTYTVASYPTISSYTNTVTLVSA